MEHNLFRPRHDFHLATNTKIPHTFVMSTNLPNQLESTLKQHFGFGEFRLGQRDVIQDLLDGHDTLIVMPTGSGKSLCYQLSALMLEGVTIIISPLISLMQDQVDSLQRQGIPATCINSSIGARANADRIVGLRTGQYKMVYVAPERFRSGGFIDALNDIQVSLVAIDEAHCISQWGHDFRPDYLRIKRVLQSLPDARIMALTATATPAVRDDIVKQLDLEDSPDNLRIHVHGFSRPNLTLSVTRASSHKHKLSTILEIMQDYPTGIVYCATRRNTERTAELLKDKGVTCSAYHGGLSDNERRDIQERFMSGKHPVVVATNAFGMGVDRHDLRFVVHWDIPGSLEAYYQEVGRAGRDGGPSHCELLYNYADVRTQEFFLDGSNPQPADLIAVWEAVARECASGPVTISGKEWSEHAALKNGMQVRSCMAILERAGMISRNMEPGSRTFTTVVTPGADSVQLVPSFEAMQYKRQLDEAKLQTMLRYASNRSCRHAFILKYFGDKEYTSNCGGYCDHCNPEIHEAAGSRRKPNENEWIVLQKVLSCIARMQGRFGIKRVIQVLQGSHAKEVLDRKLDNLTTYGILKGTPEAELRAIIDALIAERAAIITEGEYPTLAITRPVYP